jgi:hypothetical protein
MAKTKFKYLMQFFKKNVFGFNFKWRKSDSKLVFFMLEISKNWIYTTLCPY